MSAKRDRVEALYPLAPSQTGMWLQSQTAGSSALFVEQAAFRLDGALDSGALRRALQRVVERHAALRSAVLSRNDAPMRAVLRRLTVVLDESHAGGRDEDAALAALMERERTRGFALNRPPLIRFAALRCGDARTWLLVTFHHVILDGWSLGIVWEEAQAAYAAEVAGTEPAWPPVPSDRTYADWLAARSASASEAFWRTWLAGFTQPNPLAPPAGAAEARELAYAMSPAAGAALAEAARAARVSPATVVEVLWAALVAGRTRTSDVVFAATVSGRPGELAGIERMVGCFINTAPIRVRFDSVATLRAQLAAHQQQRSEQREFEYCAAGQIQSWSEVSAHRPLAQSLLVYQNAQTHAVPDRAGVPATAGAVRAHGARTAYPLTLLVTPGPAPHLRVIYRPTAFSDADAHLLAAELERLILAASGGLDRPVRELSATVAYVPVAVTGADAATPYVAPRNRLEHELAALWRELFARERVGVHDDFFALGGHSLLALQMTARARGALGIDVPLQVLVAEPTIERIAQHCAAGTVNGDADPLIPIAAGGEGIPLFCIHPLGGHVLCYAALAGRLGATHPVWGLQAQGLRAGEAPAATWDEIVEHHWALLTRATNGCVDEVALIGYSYGGYIALELAARARRLGAAHLPVVLLDVPHPAVVPAAMRGPDAAALLHALFTPALDLDLAELRRIPAAALLREVYERALRAHVLPPGTPFDDLARALAVAQAHSRLEPPPLRDDISALLLRAREGATRVSELPDLGWSRSITNLEVAWVDGRHETMLETQYVAGLADAIGAYCAASGARAAR